MIQMILTKGREFFACCREKREPALDPERDVYIPRDEDARKWAYAARDYRMLEERIQSLKDQIAVYEAQQSSIKDTLKEMCGQHVAVDFAGVAVRHSFVKGRVDYKKAMELSGIIVDADDLEACRSKPVERWSFKLTDSANCGRMV